MMVFAVINKFCYLNDVKTFYVASHNIGYDINELNKIDKPKITIIGKKHNVVFTFKSFVVPLNKKFKVALFESELDGTKYFIRITFFKKDGIV